MASLGSFLLLLFCLTASAQPTEIRGTLTRVFDGDSFLMKRLDTMKTVQVRMIGIDAPEKNQNFAVEARDALIEISGGLGAEIVVSAGAQDFHNRILGVVTSGDGIDVNLWMLQNGMAWLNIPFHKDIPIELKDSYWNAFNLSRDNSIGLFRESDPEEPWEYRWRNR